MLTIIAPKFRNLRKLLKQLESLINLQDCYRFVVIAGE